MATITSAQTGNWHTGSTWVGGSVPAADDLVVIAHGHKVTLSTDITSARTDDVTIDGNLHFAKGKLALAEKAQREAVEREPDRAACWAHLGEALLWGGKVEEGLQACNHAVANSGSDRSAKQFALNLIQAQELGCFDVED